MSIEQHDNAQAPHQHPNNQSSNDEINRQTVDMPVTFEHETPVEFVSKDYINKLGGIHGQPKRTSPSVAETENLPFWTRGKKIGTAITAFVVVSAAGIGIGSSVGGKEAPRANEGQDRVSTAPADPGEYTSTQLDQESGDSQGLNEYTENDYEEMDSRFFGTVDLKKRVAYMAPKIFSWRQGAIDVLSSRFTPEQSNLLKGDISPDSESDSDDKILRTQAVDLMDAMTQGLDPVSQDRGQKMLETMYDQQGAKLDVLYEMMKQGSYIFAFENISPENNPDLTGLDNKTLRGVKLGDGRKRLLSILDKSQSSYGQKYKILYEYEKISDTTGKWVGKGTFAIDDGQLISDLAIARKNG